MTGIPRFVVPSLIPTASAAWSETNKNSNIVLSNSDLTATAGSGATLDAAGVATVAITTGQSIYTEIVCNAKSGTSEPGVGLANAAFTFGDGNYLGIDANSVCLFQSGSVWSNNTSIAHIALFVGGDTIRVAVKKIDATTLHLWFATNGGNWNDSPTADPSTDTGGITVSISGNLFAAYNSDFASGIATQFTLVLPGTYTFSIPSGYTGYGA